MKAMILSAGFGTRLKPLTDKIPKALVLHKGIPMINYQIDRLKEAGVEEIVVNAHHFYEQLQNYFDKNDFGVKINVIVENEILGTGGGIINAKNFLGSESEFIVINVDADTDVSLKSIIDQHIKSNGALATLCVQKRKTSRYLEFTDKMLLIGRENENSNKDNLFAFNGIHVISQKFFDKELPDVFSDIISIYINLIKETGDFVSGYDAEECYFKDLGKTENIK